MGRPAVGVTSLGEEVRIRVSGAGKDGLVSADLFRRLSDEKKTAATYCSFARYFWLFKKLGFVEATTKQEDAMYPRDAHKKRLQKRTYYRITSKGRRAAEYLWSNPARSYFDSVYGPRAWEEYMRQYRQARATGRPRGRPPKEEW